MDDFYSRQKSSKAFLKFLNYIETLKNNPIFNSDLKNLRKHYIHHKDNTPLPDQGLPFPKDKKDCIDTTILYPEPKKLTKKKVMFIKKYGLEIFGEAYNFLIFYNSVDPMESMGYSAFVSILDIRDFSSEVEFFGNNTQDILLETLSETTPIGIFIHPYMSENDIIDFIKKTYKTTIQPLQSKYADINITLKNSRSKSKKKQSRDNFIYRNRTLPVKELVSLVKDNFGEVMDYTYIQTIIREEKRKRN